MKRLILDFLARWWWMLTILAVITVVATAYGLAVTFTPIVMMCLFFDAMRGVLRVAAPLPIARREQAHAWWLLTVVVVPMLWLAPLALGTLFHQLRWGVHPLLVSSGDVTFDFAEYFFGALGAASWSVAVFSAAAQAWAGFGFSAVIFLGATFLPARPAAGLEERIGHIVRGVCFSLLVLGGTFLPLYLPRHPEYLGIWNLVFFAVVPLCVVFSFLASPSLLVRRRLAAPPEFSRTRDRKVAGSDVNGLSGLPLVLRTFLGIPLVALPVVAAGEVCVLRWQIGFENAAHEAEIGLMMRMYIGMVSIMSAEVVGQWFDLRSLRTLPLSTKRLAALMLATPVVASLLGSALMCSYGFVDGWRDGGIGPFIVQFVFFCGCGTLILALVLQTTAMPVITLYFVIANLLAFVDVHFLAKMPIWTALGGGSALALGIFLILRGLRRSKAFYRPRKRFGMTLGQAMASQ